MAEKYATIKINIENGVIDASVSGDTVEIVTGFVHLFLESNETLRFVKAAIEVTEEHNLKIEQLNQD